MEIPISYPTFRFTSTVFHYKIYFLIKKGATLLYVSNFLLRWSKLYAAWFKSVFVSVKKKPTGEQIAQHPERL